MVHEPPKLSGLLPDRHPQQELFLCDVADVVLKDDIASMEHPFFSLATKPVFNPVVYENGNNWIRIVPSEIGLATIQDKDLLIFVISQMIKGHADGRPINRRVRFKAYDFLVFANRKTGGKDYETVIDALTRLDGTRIRTNVEADDEEERKGFGLIDSFRVTRSKVGNRIVEIEVTISDWVFRAIEGHKVLTLHRDYFRLRKPIERRIYEIGRKHCGKQESWRVSLDVLRKKCGSHSPKKRFKQIVKGIVDVGHMPDYELCLEGDFLEFRNRGVLAAIAEHMGDVQLDWDVYHDAKDMAPGWDIRYLEGRWRAWVTETGKEVPRDPERAFLGFCKAWYEKRGRP